jgi:valine dehydrogenase (NAD+)
VTAQELTNHDSNPSVLEAMSDPDSPHEQVIFCNDPPSGLRAIIAIHSLALGPAVGGCRFLPYDDEASALADVLRLSRGMTYKAAAAGLDTGGGKAVIIGDPSRDKTPELLEAFGRFVDRLGGNYSTAGDVGTDSDDMDIIGRATRHVAFRTTGRGGSGDSGSNTALGVFQGILAAAEHRWGSPELRGRHVGVEGLGKVGFQLAVMLHDAGARVTAADPSELARVKATSALPDLRIVESVRELRADVYAPCGLGGTLDHDLARRIEAEIVCGGANNQLASHDVAEVLLRAGVTWVPDFVANVGGLIQAVAELRGETSASARERVLGVRATVLDILENAGATGSTTLHAAEAKARRHLAAARSRRSAG